MLAIRLQRTGRKGLAQYRVIVQEAHKSPKSEKIIARLGHYNPHTKELVVDKDKAEQYLKNGAQPSDRVARLFKTEKIELPKWVELKPKQDKKVKNIEKLRKNRPAEEKPAEAQEDTKEKNDEKENQEKPEDTTADQNDGEKESENAENEENTEVKEASSEKTE